MNQLFLEMINVFCDDTESKEEKKCDEDLLDTKLMKVDDVKKKINEVKTSFNYTDIMKEKIAIEILAIAHQIHGLNKDESQFTFYDCFKKVELTKKGVISELSFRIALERLSLLYSPL